MLQQRWQRSLWACVSQWLPNSMAWTTRATLKRRSVARGRDLENMFALFRTRVGMAYPFGWLLQYNVLAPAQFWILTLLADAVTLGALFAGTWWLTGTTRAAMVAVILYSAYPFAVQQSVMFYPSAFQTMFIALAIALIGGAERGTMRYRTSAMFAAGAALGLAYFVKEDATLSFRILRRVDRGGLSRPRGAVGLPRRCGGLLRRMRRLSGDDRQFTVSTLGDLGVREVRRFRAGNAATSTNGTPI